MAKQLKIWSANWTFSRTSRSGYLGLPRKATCVRHLSLAYILHKPPEAKAKSPSESLIILHGLFGSKSNSRSIGKVLARDLRRSVYTLDLRNHGDSPHDSTHTYAAMASDVEEFIRAHGLKSPIVIGHSMGAKVAMTIALQSPRLLKAMISVDNAPVAAALKSNFLKYVKGMQEIENAKVCKQTDANNILKSYEEALPIRQFLLTNLVRAAGANHIRLRIPINILAENLDKMGGFPFKDPSETRYEGPTLFIRGLRSHYMGDDVLPIIGSFFPNFELREIDCGHWVISEKPEAFREAVVDFILRHDKPMTTEQSGRS